MIILLILVVILYILALRCRKGHPGLPALQGWAYAHRGLHGDGVPENSMKAFELALSNGYGVELDVHLMADGELAVIHDSSLKRTAGADVKIEELTASDLEHYNLEGTDEKIPLFRDVLTLFAGKAPIIVELKVEQNNYADLASTACKMLEQYQGPYCVESFDPRAIQWLRKHKPDMIRGQLTENFFKTPNCKLPWALKFVMAKQLMNFLSVPDFIAYRCSDRKRLGNTICRKFWGAQGVTWTIKSKADFDAAVKDGWLPIFEGFRP